VKYVEAAGVRLSAIGVGTWQFGSREWGYGKEYAETTAVDIVQRALDLGVNLIDTAEIYGFGMSERIVGRAVAALGDGRQRAYLATKVFPVLPLAPVVEQRGRASAARLGVDVVDLYQVHWPNPVVPIGPTMSGMRRLQDAGVVRSVGVSNFSADQWRAAEEALGRPVVTNQVQYSLVARRPEREILPHAVAADRIVIAYSPLAQGLLSARYDASNVPGGVRAGNSLFLPENLERAGPLLTALREVAAAHDAKPAQVALAWVIRRRNVVAIPGASTVEQLESNVAAADLDLTDEEDERLTAAADAFEPVTGVAAVPSLVRARLRR
jgi:aryl-alcohol dehydrogenase-like predicted oxidoreductase